MLFICWPKMKQRNETKWFKPHFQYERPHYNGIFSNNTLILHFSNKSDYCTTTTHPANVQKLDWGEMKRNLYELL